MYKGKSATYNCLKSQNFSLARDFLVKIKQLVGFKAQSVTFNCLKSKIFSLAGVRFPYKNKTFITFYRLKCHFQRSKMHNFITSDHFWQRIFSKLSTGTLVRKSNKNVNNQFCGEKKIEWLFFGPKNWLHWTFSGSFDVQWLFFSWEDTMY